MVLEAYSFESTAMRVPNGAAFLAKEPYIA